MVALSRKFHSRPVFISVCSEIFVVTGRKTIRLDEAAEKRKTASAYLFDIFLFEISYDLWNKHELPYKLPKDRT